MHSKARFPNVIFGASLRPQGVTLAILVMLLFVLLFMTLTVQTAPAPTACLTSLCSWNENVLHRD